MATEQGYSNQKKKGSAQFKTIHNVGSDSFGTVSFSKSLYDISLTDQTIVSVSDVIGSDGQIKFWKLQIVAHGASVGNILRITSGTLKNFEFEVMAVVDADNIHILPISSSRPLALDTAKIMGWVTAKSDDQGNPQVSLAPAPVKFLLDGVTTDVSEDTSVPANNTALPSLNYIVKDGVQVPVTKDTGVPSNTIGIPVEIVSGSGTEINITAGDINIQTTDMGLNFDSMRIGDGSGNYIGVTAFDEAKVNDASANSTLSSLDNKIIEDAAVITSNSTTTPLGAGGVFTGSAFEILKYSVVNVGLISDVPSATDGVKLEVSPDGINWDHSHKTTYAGGSGIGYIFNSEFRYARVVYTNGASAQSVFRLQTIVKKNFTKQSLYTIDQAVNGNMFVELGKNVIIGKTTGGGGGFIDVKVNPSGALTVDATVSSSALPTGAATEAKQDIGNTSLSSIDTKLTGVATSALQTTGNSSLSSIDTKLSSQATAANQSTSNTRLGDLTETAPATDTASSGLNGRLQRIAQRLSTLITNFGALSDSKVFDPDAASANSLQLLRGVIFRLANVENYLTTIQDGTKVYIGTINNASVTVGTTPVRATFDGNAPLGVRKRLVIKPSKNNTGSIFIGNSSVTTLNGLEIIGPDRVVFENDQSDYYLISDTAGQKVEIIEVTA